MDRKRPKKTRALTAAGQRVVPDAAPPAGSAVDRGKQQAQAWQFRALVPELRFVGGFVATQMSRVRWYAAEAGPDGAEPRPLTGEPPDPDDDNQHEPLVSEATAKIAMDAIERLDLNSRGSSMAGRAGENFEYAGECFMLGEQDPKTGQERWSIRSVREIRYSKEKQKCPVCGERHYQAFLVEPGANMHQQGKLLPLCEVELFRLWNPDPECHEWADAKITACLGVLDEIVTYDAQARAAAKSRISSGSILFVPEEFSLSRPGSAPVDIATDAAEDDEDIAMSELTSAMLTPISSQTDPSAIVPIIVRGPATIDGQPMKDLIGVVQIPREDIKDSIQKREAAVTKLAHGMDIPPEIVTGLGDSTHWNAWTISDAVVKNHLEPRAEMFADSLTESYLRETCLAQGCDPEEVAHLCVWFDCTELSQPADPLATAQKLHDADVLSDAEFARAGGYDEDAMPTDVEKLYRALSKGRIAPQAVPLMVALVAEGSKDPRLILASKIAQQMAVASTALPGPSADRHIIDYGTASSPADVKAQTQNAPQATPPDPVPAKGLPATAPDPTNPAGPRVAVTASASKTPEPMYRVDEAACRELGDVDAQLVAELGGFIDAQILRAVEKAAGRIRSKAMRGGRPDEAALFASSRREGEAVDPLAVVAAAGPGFTWSIGDQQALEGSLDKIRARWSTAVRRAAHDVTRLLRKLTGHTPPRDVAADMERRAAQAWPQLEQAIRDTTTKVLHGDTDVDLDDLGNGPILPRSAITDALTDVGGADPGLSTAADQPATGIAAGPIVADALADAGATNLGYSWRYHSHTREPFPPHVSLSGERFTGWDDPKLITPPDYAWIGSPFLHPSDHRGCGCSVSIIAATPTVTGDLPGTPDADDLWTERETDRQRETRELAEADLRAGRTNTHAVRKYRQTQELRDLRRKHVTDRQEVNA